MHTCEWEKDKIYKVLRERGELSRGRAWRVGGGGDQYTVALLVSFEYLSTELSSTRTTQSKQNSHSLAWHRMQNPANSRNVTLYLILMNSSREWNECWSRMFWESSEASRGRDLQRCNKGLFFFFVVRKSAPEQLLPSCENRSYQKNISLRNQRAQKNSRCHRMSQRFLSIVVFFFFF